MHIGERVVCLLWPEAAGFHAPSAELAPGKYHMCVAVFLEEASSCVVLSCVVLPYLVLSCLVLIDSRRGFPCFVVEDTQRHDTARRLNTNTNTPPPSVTSLTNEERRKGRCAAFVRSSCGTIGLPVTDGTQPAARSLHGLDSVLVAVLPLPPLPFTHKP